MTFRPKYVTFDCYGTLTDFDMAGAARRVYGAALSEPAMAAFIRHFAAYRLDEGARRLEALRRGGAQRGGAHLQAGRHRLPPGGRRAHL